jgi:hypothetical protein
MSAFGGKAGSTILSRIILVLCPSITMERLTLEDFMTLVRVERETWYTVSSSLVAGVGTLVISIKSDKDRDAKSAPHAFIGVLGS